MAWTEQDLREIEDELKKGSQGVGDVPEAESLDGITSLPAYQEVEGQDIIVRAPLTLLAAPALEAADKANAAATKAESNATAAQTAANSANEKAGLAAQAASDANAAKEGAEAATQSANTAASNAEEKATAANTAALNAEKVANNPTYIGKDHYVYVYNKKTESFDKTDIYCKGEPGSSFRVAGEYATLEALKSAVPDGSAVDGFMAVGTEAPYDYYAWVNGEWVSQGKISGMDEAPTDGKAYGRKNGDWAEVSDKKYVDDSISSARSVGYMMQLAEIDASGLDENTWYPVIIKLDTLNFYRIEVHATLGMTGSPSWAEHDEGFVTHKIWEVNAEGYGTAQIVRNIFISTYRFANIDPVRGIGQLTRNSFEYVYVRGGGKYQFYTSHKFNIQLITSRLEVGYEEVIEPTTETPAEIVANIATKEYVDTANFGHTIFLSNVNNILTNTNIQGVEAEQLANDVFGSLGKFREIINDILNTHSRYYFHLDEANTNCIELGSVNAWKATNETSFELHFIICYYTNGTTYTKRISVIINNETDASKFIIKDLVASDNLTTLTKKTAAEYEAIGSKDANTAYCVTD